MAQKSDWKTALWLFFFISLICAFIFVPYIAGKTAFVLGWDMRTLYSSNFEALRTQVQEWISTRHFHFWSWVSFLGNDYYSSKLFYFQDPFDYPFALTHLPYTTIIMIQTYLKFLVAGFSFHAYSAYRGYSRRTCLTGALIFAFSAYNLQTMMHPFFGSFFVFLPLYFLSVDRYLTQSRKIGFILMVAFLLINNYYLFYSVSLCTILYFIYRYQAIHGTMKGLMKEAILLIGCYMIGLLCSGIIVLPEVLQILANSRVGARSSVWLYDSILPYLNYLVGLFTPTSALANRNTPISLLYSYTSANNSVMAVFLWSSSLTTYLLPQRLSRRNRKPIDLWMALIVTMIALIPALSSAMHGFSEPSFRWLGSISFFLVASILPLIENRDLIQMPLLKKSIFAFPLLLAVSTPVLCLVQGASWTDILKEYWIVLAFIPTLALTGIYLLKNRQKAVLISTVIELCLASFLSFYGNPEFTKRSKQDVQRAATLMGAKNEYNDYLLSIDPANSSSFYRSYIDPVDVYWQISSNYNLDFNIRGLLTYDSTYHHSANELKKLGTVTSYLAWTFDIEDPNIMNLASTKYAVVTKEERVPFRHYRKIGEYREIPVYENLDYINLGETYTQVIPYEDYSSDDTSEVTETVIADAGDVDEIRSLLGTERVQCTYATADGDSVYAGMTLSAKGFAVLSVPYDTGWHVTVNGRAVRTYQVNGGFTGLALEAGYNEIQMSYTPNGFRAGGIMSLGGIILLAAAAACDIRRRRPQKRKEDRPEQELQ